MRFLVFGLLLLTTAFVAESRSLVKRDTTQDDLVKEIQELRDIVRKELVKLKAEGKTNVDKVLLLADVALVDLEAEARRLQPTTDAGKALLTKAEDAFNKLKMMVEDEIKKLDGGFFAEDPTETAILKNVGDLYDQAVKEIETESKTKKTEVVSAIQTTQKVVKDIEDKVKAFKVTGDLEKQLIEVALKLIAKGEDILDGALKAVQSGTALPDNKAVFVGQVKALYEEAMKVFEELDKKDKVTLKTELTKLIDVVQQIQKEIDDAIPQIKIAKSLFEGVQSLVKTIVGFLELKLKSIGGYYEADPLEDALLKLVGDLYDNALKAILTLANTGTDAVVQALESSVKFVQSLEEKNKALKPTNDLEKALVDLFDTLSKKGEQYLTEAEKDAKSGSEIKDNKPELVGLVKQIYQKADTYIDSLKKSDMTKVKDEITKTIALGKLIQTDFKTFKPTNDISKAILAGNQALVDAVVTGLEAALKEIGGFYADDPTETAILKNVGDLYDQAVKEIETESKTKKAEVVSAIQTTQKVVKDIEDKVKAFKVTGDLEKQLIEVALKLITKGEDILDGALKAVQSGTALPDNKAVFVGQVKALYEEAMKVFEELDKKDKVTLKTELTKLIDVVQQIQKEIDDAIPQIKIAKQLFEGVQSLVKTIVGFLQLKLKSIGGF